MFLMEERRLFFANHRNLNYWMRFHKFKIDSYCVGCRNRSARKNMYGDITSKGNKVLFGFCWKSHGKKHTTPSDKTIIA